MRIALQKMVEDYMRCREYLEQVNKESTLSYSHVSQISL